MRKMLGVAVMATLVLAMNVSAQDGPRARHGRFMRMAGGKPPIERIIEHREELKLTDAQVAQLQVIAQEQKAHRDAMQKQMEAMREKIKSGEVQPDRERMRERFREQGKDMRERMEATRDRVEQILTEEQRDQLQNIREERMREHRGRRTR